MNIQVRHRYNMEEYFLPIKCAMQCIRTVLLVKKDKIDPVQVMKAYRGSRGIAPLVLGTRWR
jgi:hypothetical protein